MEVSKLPDFVGGWFIGNFTPSLITTEEFEVCIKRYRAGETEDEHFQKTAVEFTIIISGNCRIGPHLLGPDDILRINPHEPADFLALNDVVLVAVKTPSNPDDKVLGVPGGR